MGNKTPLNVYWLVQDLISLIKALFKDSDHVSLFFGIPAAGELVHWSFFSKVF